MAKSSLVIADIVLLGSVPRGRALLRSGARAGDLIYVTGALGGAAAELRALERRPAAFRRTDKLRHPHLYPEPRLAAGRKLLRLATAAIDLSDGLSTDLAHVCQESGLAAEIDAEAIPVDARATLEQALHGGEDYELLFTASPKTRVPRQLGGVLVHCHWQDEEAGQGPASRAGSRGQGYARSRLVDGSTSARDEFGGSPECGTLVRGIGFLNPRERSFSNFLGL